MPLIDDPNVKGSIFVPRGYIPLPGSEEETKPTKPIVPEEEPTVVPEWAPSATDRMLTAGAAILNPLLGSAAILGTIPTVQSAFRLENTIVSGIAQVQDTLGVNNDLVDPTYSPWDDVVGTVYEPYWRSTFAYSNNRSYTDALKRSIDRQENDRRIVQASGFGGMVAAILAGTIDPTLLLPVGGEISLVGKGMWRVGKGALVGARAGAIGVGTQEALLQATQDTRTGLESAFNISTGVVLGAVLGGAIGGALSRTERVASEAGLEKIYNEPVPGSLGAAAPQRMTLDDLTVEGTIARNVASATAFSPNLRGNFRESPLARQTYFELGSNTLWQQGHLQGRTAGSSIVDEINVSLGETLGRALDEHPNIFQEGKKAGMGMSASQFDEAVGQAMRRGDVGTNEFVTKAAQMWRKTVIQPLAKNAIDLGMLPEDVTVREAESYFSRMYNIDKITANRGEFLTQVKDEFNTILKANYATDVQKLRARQASLEEEIANMKLTPEERVAKLEELTSTKERLEQDFAREEEVAEEIRGLNALIRKAKDEGDTDRVEQLKVQRENVRGSAGESFQDYKKALAEINKTIRQINLGYAGLADKADVVRQQLTDLTASNFKVLRRLVDRGNALSQKLARLDPEKAQAEVQKLRGDFYAMIVKSEQAQDRLAARIAKLKEGEDAEVQAALKAAGIEDPPKNKTQAKKAAKIEKDVRANSTKVADALEKGLAAEQRRTARLSALNDRLAAAEAIDHTADIAEIKQTIDALTIEASTKGLGQGEKAVELLARLAKLDPKKVDGHVTQLELMKGTLDRNFLDKWEIKRLGQGVDPYTDDLVPDFGPHSEEIAQEIFDSITHADYGSASVDPGFHLSAKSGPLKERTFHMADLKIEPWLESNVVKVMSRFARQMSSQIEISRKFPGDPTLSKRFQDIKREYDILKDNAKSAKEQQKLDNDMKSAFRDLRALLELHRGVYKQDENASNFGRLVRSLMNFNYFRSMGGAALPSLADIYQPAVFHGLKAYMGAGVPNLAKALGNTHPVVREAKYAGVSERLSHHRMLTMAEIGDPYAPNTAIERMMEQGTNLASRWNGLNWLTDFQKKFGSIIVQDRLNTALLKGTDDPFLAYSGMNQTMRTKVSDQLKTHGEEIDGIMVANTEQWDDFEAVRAYRVAISKNVNADIVTRQYGDVPLALYSPGWKMLTQFKTFALAAHQRTLLRSMQLPTAQFLSGLIGLTTIGMFTASLKAWRTGREGWDRFLESSTNPGFMISEGLDNTGMFTIPLELGNVMEKFTAGTGLKAGGKPFAFNPVKAPLLYAGRAIVPDSPVQGNSTRFAGRGPWGSVLGPTAGLVEDSVIAGTGGANLALGEEVTKGQERAATRIVPFSSYAGMREFLQLLTDNSPYVEPSE